MAWVLGDYATLNDVRVEMGTTSTDKDALTEDYIRRASAQIEDFCQRRFYAAAETRKYHAIDNVLEADLLLDWDLLEVTTITLGTGDELPADEYFLLPSNFSQKSGIRIKTTSSHAWAQFLLDPTGAITIAGSWGYNSGTLPPSVIRDACIRLVQYRLHRRLAPFETAGSGDKDAYQVSVQIPQEIQSMLLPYRRRLIYGVQP